MKTTTEVLQKVQLVKGGFTPSESFDLLIGLIDEKINFHKLQRLRWCEGYFAADTSYADRRIEELQAEKNRIKEFVKQARETGRCISINGTLELRLEHHIEAGNP